MSVCRRKHRMIMLKVALTGGGRRCGMNVTTSDCLKCCTEYGTDIMLLQLAVENGCHAVSGLCETGSGAWSQLVVGADMFHRPELYRTDTNSTGTMRMRMLMLRRCCSCSFPTRRRDDMLVPVVCLFCSGPSQRHRGEQHSGCDCSEAVLDAMMSVHMRAGVRD